MKIGTPRQPIEPPATAANWNAIKAAVAQAKFPAASIGFGGNAFHSFGVTPNELEGYLLTADADKVTHADLKRLPRRIKRADGTDAAVFVTLRRDGATVAYAQAGFDRVLLPNEKPGVLDVRRDASGKAQLFLLSDVLK